MISVVVRRPTEVVAESLKTDDGSEIALEYGRSYKYGAFFVEQSVISVVVRRPTDVVAENMRLADPVVIIGGEHDGSEIALEYGRSYKYGEFLWSRE